MQPSRTQMTENQLPDMSSCPKKQTTIVLSSMEAEYVALSEAAHEAMWLYQLYGELEYTQPEPILILGDNDG